MTTDLFNVNKYRRDFPVLKETVRGKTLVYLDNAATTLKPQSVIDKMDEYYYKYCANVHRGVHFLSEKATAELESARKTVQEYIGAESKTEIIFTRGTTESVNLVASSFSEAFIGEGDEILITEMEHHSNIVPWQMVCERKKARLKVVPINDKGELIFDEFEKLLSEKTKIVSVVYVSNALGSVNPVKKIIESAHKRNIPVFVDAAQAVSHVKINVVELNCDFLAFSGHKVFGPTGIGVLYGKKNLLDRMPPYQGGGEMISSVSFDKTTYNVLPYKFEAGTPNISGIIGLAGALDYLKSVGIENVYNYEKELLSYGIKKLFEIPGIKLIGTSSDKASILSFVLPEVHAHDLGTIVDGEGVAIRTGHHCAQPVMRHFNVAATSRASLAFYNTKEEIDVLADAVKKARKVFG